MQFSLIASATYNGRATHMVCIDGVNHTFNEDVAGGYLQIGKFRVHRNLNLVASGYSSDKFHLSEAVYAVEVGRFIWQSTGRLNLSSE